MNIRLACAALLAAGALTVGEVNAQSSDFYRGKQIQLVVSTATGGGYDAYARTLARHFVHHLPGTPSIVVQNMPGAGGLRATNHMYNSAAADGTVIGLVHGSMTTADLLTPDGAQFDATKFGWVGNIDGEPGFCAAWHASPVKSINDLKTREFVVGSTGSGAGLDIHPRVLAKLLGAKTRVISGYPGGADVALAMERGEVDGRCSWPISAIEVMRPTWLPDKRINLLVQFGLEKHPNFPNVPLITELVSDPDTKAALELILAERELLRPIMAPPGIPPARLSILRKAFMDTMANPAFVADANKQSLGVNPMDGAKMQSLIERVHKVSPELVKRALELAS